MRSVSDAFLRTVAGSHTIAVRARVVETYQSTTDPDGTEISVINGAVSAAADDPIRARLDLVTEGAGMWPTRANLLLAPYGNEIYVERGVVYGNGLTEYVGLGYFRIQAPDQEDVPRDGQIRIEARDRMALIVDARRVAPRQYAASDSYGTVVEDLVTEVYPAATIEWDDATSGDTLGRDLIAQEDRYGFLNELLTGVGKIWGFDHRGVLVIRTQPTESQPVVEIGAGAGGVLVTAARRISRDGVYNIVVATGEAADTGDPVRAVAFDDNPASPTYWRGAFGPVPTFFTSPSLTSYSQAASAAAALLRRTIGLPYLINFAAVPNPALEPWDPIGIRYSSRSGIEHHLIDQLTIPLTPEAPMTAATRAQPTVLIGLS